MSINELFHNETKETTNARALSGTAELTKISNNVAVRIIHEMENDIDAYRERIAKSATDSKELEALLEEFKPWCDIDEDHPLRHLDDATVEGMLKSQQSKRSRTKSKAMTLDNYCTLMTAAIAENLLREMYDKPKAANMGHRRSSLDYTAAELEYYADNQEALRKEIRNIQSKKSIMKSKADFDESNEQWVALLRAEQMLKDLKVNNSVVEVDKTKDALKELLAGKNLDEMSDEDRETLLKSVAGMIGGDADDSEF